MVVLEIEACKPPRNDLKFVSVIEMTFLYDTWYSVVLLRLKNKVNRICANASGAFSKKTVTPVLLNALDSTRYYVGSYAGDARLMPSRLSKQVKKCSTMAATSAGRKRRPWSTTIIGPHVAGLRGSLGTSSAKGSIARADFAA